MQELSPDRIKGRVLSLQLVLYNALSIPIILFIGGLTDLYGIRHVLYLLAAGEIAFGIWGIYYEHKHPPEIQIKEEKEALAPQKESETENIHLH